MNIPLLIVSLLVVLLGVVGTLSSLAPVRMAYTETIEIDASANQLYDDIRLQERLMRWSAWPKETGSQCAVDPGPKGADGREGARTVFIMNGKPVGHQRIERLADGRTITMSLEGPGPPHRPSMTFEVEPLDAGRSRVHLRFVNELPRPFNAIWRFAGLSAWTRKTHRKDLEGLKAFAEPPHRDADGRVVGRTPSAPNPYEVPLPQPGT
ncbi:MAG: SRPBCC family protein [Myxococcota bacterium]